MTSLQRYVGTICVACLALSSGCTQSKTAGVSAESDKAKAELEAAQPEVRTADTEVEKSKADATSARLEAVAVKPIAVPDAERRAAEMVRALGGGLEVALLEGGYQFGVKPTDNLPEKPFRLHLISFNSNPKPIDDALAELKGLSVHTLWLSSSRITDAGLAHLKEIRDLQGLTLNHTEVTDAGLIHLKAVTHLKELFISDTHITDAGLAHLEGLSELQKVDLTRTSVTDEGVEKLKASAPNLIVER